MGAQNMAWALLQRERGRKFDVLYQDDLGARILEARRSQAALERYRGSKEDQSKTCQIELTLDNWAEEADQCMKYWVERWDNTKEWRKMMDSITKIMGTWSTQSESMSKWSERQRQVEEWQQLMESEEWGKVSWRVLVTQALETQPTLNADSGTDLRRSESPPTVQRRPRERRQDAARDRTGTPTNAARGERQNEHEDGTPEKEDGRTVRGKKYRR